jgi:NADH dehydrogenase [ubiquinone] 1 alpha subcomplex assembly factor 7
MTPLGAEIAARIARDGPISVADYMRLCLSHPTLGYYRTRTAIGAAGDFTTAPEISQVFGELIGLWCAELWSTMGRPQTVHLVELGPGRGTLMADALRAATKVAPDFRAALDVHLVEINPVLREAQAKALTEARPMWHASIDTLPTGPLLVIANEFFDALPVQQFVRAADSWRTRAVTVEDKRFVFTAGEPAALQHEAEIGTIIERSPEREAMAGWLAQRIAQHGGGGLLIDYGSPAHGHGDTLQALRAQQKVDPLAEPGLADLTTHVDFQSLANAARAAGATVYGPLPQGRFLQRLGINARAATLTKASPHQAQGIATAIGRLIDDAQMGTLFKVLALLPPELPLPAGFDPPC